MLVYDSTLLSISSSFHFPSIDTGYVRFDEARMYTRGVRLLPPATSTKANLYIS
jgi:hypothetical protein